MRTEAHIVFSGFRVQPRKGHNSVNTCQTEKAVLLFLWSIYLLDINDEAVIALRKKITHNYVLNR